MSIKKVSHLRNKNQVEFKNGGTKWNSVAFQLHVGLMTLLQYRGGELMCHFL